MFKKILEGFNQIRKEKSSKNNFTDAVVLCIIHKRFKRLYRVKFIRFTCFLL
jgi:hypothetical protein